MTERLKLCPRCASEVLIIPEDDIENFGTDKWYACSNSKCVFHHINLLPIDWQSRPIEEALEIKLIEAEKLLKSLAYDGR